MNYVIQLYNIVLLNSERGARASLSVTCVV